MDNIKAVLLDIDNTLLDFGVCARESMKAAFADYGLTYSDNIETIFHKINDALWRKVERGEFDKEDVYKVRWNMVFEKAGMETLYDGFAFDKCFRIHITECAYPVEGANDLLEYLSGKYTLYAASNASYDQQIKRLEAADMLGYFKDFFISERIGAPKPQKEFFEGCMKELWDTKKDEVVMIGDSLNADIKGARKFGLKYIWFNYRRGKVPPEMEDKPTVYKLSEIKEIL